MVIATNISVDESNSSAVSSSLLPSGSTNSMGESSAESGSSASFTSSIGGHAWIEFINGNETTTYGTYGNTGDQEFWQDREKGVEPVVMRMVAIGSEEVKKINEFNSDPENVNWSVWYTCAGYACALWNYITGEDLSASDFAGASTSPSALSESIYHANGDSEVGCYSSNP